MSLPARVPASSATDVLHPYTRILSPRDDFAEKGELGRCGVPHLRHYFEHIGRFPSPLLTATETHSLGRSFVPDEETVLGDIVARWGDPSVSREYMRSGPREFIAFHQQSAKAAIVTCGGLCPGINTVVREIFLALRNIYGVREVHGVQMGYRGFYASDLNTVPLSDDFVKGIQHRGGSVLGSTRGGFDLGLIVDSIASRGFNQVYIIGGDGTQRGAYKIFEECMRRRLMVSVVGIPKTIDNDIAIIDHSFGFVTAVQEAQRAIRAAYVEATSGFNGIGLVRLMGRNSGYISMLATLASGDVDVCLIPEIDFDLDGPQGLLIHIEHLLRQKKYCVIVVAEGAGLKHIQKACESGQDVDASGNVKMPNVGLWLAENINCWFSNRGIEVNLKYIDPSYEIRSVPAVATDNIMCTLLAQSAVHGAMAGFTGFTCGTVNTHQVMIPMKEIISKGRTRVDLSSRMWHRVLASTLQPPLKNK
jgi:6-phosphofructokinase 1